MANEHKKKIAVVVGNGFEDVELTQPVEALEGAGHAVTYVGVKPGQEVVGKRGQAKVTIETSAQDVDPAAFDALLIPGGHSPDNIRTDEGVVGFVKRFAELNRPIAAVCHGPQLLIEADLVRGRRMTSWPSVRTDLKNAGAEVEDEAVVKDGIFITSRNPDDLEAFDRALLGALEPKGGGVQEATSR